MTVIPHVHSHHHAAIIMLIVKETYSFRCAKNLLVSEIVFDVDWLYIKIFNIAFLDLLCKVHDKTKSRSFLMLFLSIILFLLHHHNFEFPWTSFFLLPLLYALLLPLVLQFLTPLLFLFLNLSCIHSFSIAINPLSLFFTLWHLPSVSSLYFAHTISSFPCPPSFNYCSFFVVKVSFSLLPLPFCPNLGSLTLHSSSP